jgi:hypothetical protein
MVTLAIVGLTLIQITQIGSGLSAGSQLIYESAGVIQAPWVYDSVRVVERGGFDRCIASMRRSQPMRENCTRGDTLFEKTSTEEFRAIRPIGPHMALDIRTATGNVLRYSTDSVVLGHIAGGPHVAYLPTSILTLDRAGVVIRRLREHYAPALLTAVWGVFEEPDGSGGWTRVREFALIEVRPPVPGLDPSVSTRSGARGRASGKGLRSSRCGVRPQI